MYQMYNITNEASLRHAINDYIRFYLTERPQDRYHCKTSLKAKNETLQSGQAQLIRLLKINELRTIKKNGVHRKTTAQS